MGILLLPAFIIAAIYTAYSWTVYNKIKRIGVAGFGRLISCKRKYSTRISMMLPHYAPIVEFYYAEKRYEIRAMGSFVTSPPAEVGDEIAIIFSEEYFGKVVIVRDESILERYITKFLFYLILCVAIPLYLVFLL